MDGIEKINQMPQDNDPFHEARVELGKYVVREGFNAEETTEAYYHILGIADSEEVPERLKPLVERMEKLSNDGFPLNQFNTIIGMKQLMESFVPKLQELVEGLKISDNEKRMLRSIAEKSRAGTLTCNVNGKKMVDVKIQHLAKHPEPSSGRIFKTLNIIMERIPEGAKYDFEFVED